MDTDCVYAENDYAFVAIDNNGLKCSTCNFNSHNCRHIKFLEVKINQDDVDLPDFLYKIYHLAKIGRKIEWKPCCVSKIQFHPPTHVQQILCSSYQLFLPHENGNLLIVQSVTGVCRSCVSNWSGANPVEKKLEG